MPPHTFLRKFLSIIPYDIKANFAKELVWQIERMNTSLYADDHFFTSIRRLYGILWNVSNPLPLFVPEDDVTTALA